MRGLRCRLADSLKFLCRRSCQGRGRTLSIQPLWAAALGQRLGQGLARPAFDKEFL